MIPVIRLFAALVFALGTLCAVSWSVVTYVALIGPIMGPLLMTIGILSLPIVALSIGGFDWR